MLLMGKGLKCIRAKIYLVFSMLRGWISLKGLAVKTSDELSTVPVDNLLNNFYLELPRLI